MRRPTAILVLVMAASQASVLAQRPAPANTREGAPRAAAAEATAKPAPNAPPVDLTAAVKPPVGYVIGTDDVLQVVFWRDEAMSREVVVRPDGMITLPLINDVVAGGLTPEQLRLKVVEAAAKLMEDPTPSVIVKQINSRKVTVTGEIQRPGQYNLTAPLRVMSLIGIAGGPTEYAKRDEIIVLRDENGEQKVFTLNYDDVSRGKKLEQNIYLMPGDMVIVNGG